MPTHARALPQAQIWGGTLEETHRGGEEEGAVPQRDRYPSPEFLILYHIN